MQIKRAAKPVGRPCLSKLNLANLSKEENADIQLDMRASRLIRLVKLGKKSKQSIRDEIDQEFDEEIKEKFKLYLNKYNKMMKTKSRGIK